MTLPKPKAAPATTAAEIVAANVRMACARVGWNASDLSRAIGMARNAVGLRWRGERQWQLEDLDIVAKTLGTTPWDLMTPAPGDHWSPGTPEAPAGGAGASKKLLRLDSNQQPSERPIWALAA